MPLPVNIYHTVGGRSFERCEVAEDGHCGYTSFGITRPEAYKQIFQNLHKEEVSKLLYFAVKEELLKEEFCSYVEERGFSRSLISTFYSYTFAARPNNRVEQKLQELEAFAKDLNIITAYLQYDVQDEKVDGGWCHPCVLQALAHVREIRLTIWVKGDHQLLVPHKYYHQYIPQVAEENKHLLFVNGNHFELLLENFSHTNENNNTKKPESSFSGSGTVTIQTTKIESTKLAVKNDDWDSFKDERKNLAQGSKEETTHFQQILTTLVEKLSKVNEQFKFTFKRCSTDELLIKFASADSVSMTENEIREYLIPLLNSLRTKLQEMGLESELKAGWKLNWKSYELKLTLSSIEQMNRITEFLRIAGANYLEEEFNAYSKTFFLQGANKNSSSRSAEEESDTVRCILQ